MNKLVGVRWGDLSEEIKSKLLERAFYEGTGELIVDFNENLSVAGEIIDNGEEKELVIKDDAIIYNPSEGIISEPKKIILEINEVMTFAEATQRWGLADSTLRKLATTNKLLEGLDFRKSGKVWLITREAMERVYGKR